MNVSRRNFLRNAGMVSVGFAGLRNITGCASTGESALDLPLKPDPKKLFDLPEGFSYTAFSQQGEKMDDGLLVPGKHDGMAAFEAPGGRTILIRNHELDTGDKEVGAFGKNNELLERPDQHRFYDFGKGQKPGLGGTTTLVYNTRERKLEKHWLSLAGTLRNCAGGATPWNTWITCEETMSGPDDQLEKEHGYNFEVPAHATELVKALPLKEMGRFNHEAIAVDPRSGVVYETEDRGNSLIYRYLPNEKGRMIAGGKLEALRIKGRTVTDTRNWGKTRTMREGDVFDVDWVDVSDFDPGEDELRVYGHYAHGCARFARGEGMWYGRDSIYFACTTGGHARKGQIFRYYPSLYEGTSEENNSPGRLELFVEPNDNAICENADNLCVAPWGDLFLCEDNDGKATPEQYLLGVTPTGHVYRFGKNALNHAELAGVCFSPDGSTLFVNIYTPGITLAITGPWEQALKDVSRKSMALAYHPV
jgi:secreted PhoX family phosphatase